MTAADRFDSLFQYHGSAPLPWALLKRQAEAESGMNPDAVSPVGAQGLTQFMPATFAEWARREKLAHPSPWNPEHAITLQAAYMRDLLARFGNDMRKAIAAYNWGQGRVRQAVIAHGAEWELALPIETRNYLARILGA